MTNGGTWTKILATTALFAALAGCGGTNGDSSDEAGNSEPSTLNLGDSHDFEIEALDGDTQRFTLAIDEVVAGKPADLDDLQGGQKHEGQTPWYLVTSETSHDSTKRPGVTLRVTADSGEPATNLTILMGSIGRCADDEFRAFASQQEVTQGQATPRCAVVLLPDGATPKTADLSLGGMTSLATWQLD